MFHRQVSYASLRHNAISVPTRLRLTIPNGRGLFCCVVSRYPHYRKGGVQLILCLLGILRNAELIR